jgi:ABC-type dipeptide/oligopeptide/nickel transport system ATPase component
MTIAPLSACLLSLRNFSAGYGGEQVLRELDLDLCAGGTIAIAGPSGCGKTTLLLALMRLLPPNGFVVGSARLLLTRDSAVGFAHKAEASESALRESVELTSASETVLRRLRGREMSLVMQEPLTAMNPRLSVGDHIVEAIRLHRPMARREAWREAVELLDRLGIAGAAARAREYAHQFSGGMRQRALIAVAVANRPRLILCDEPTSALDPVTRRETLALLRGLATEWGSTVVLVTHDLFAVAGLAERLVVVHEGRIVEDRPARQVLEAPAHPYTQALLSARRSWRNSARNRSKAAGTGESVQPAAVDGVGGHATAEATQDAAAKSAAAGNEERGR